MRSPDRPARQRARLWPLLVKELWDIAGGRALWTMLLVLCPLVGFSFHQAVALYGEASAATVQSPTLAGGLSPLDGILVPTLGAFYVTVTLLFPFVAIRVLGHEKETGALRLLIQLPYPSAALIAAKLAAVLLAWLLAAVPVMSALAIWVMLGGHLHPPESFNLLFGHLLYGLLVGAIALFAASISEGAATAAIITLAFTIGSWVLDFAAAGRPGPLEWLSHLSLTQALRPFEQGLLSAGLVAGIAAASLGFAALAAVWLPPGMRIRTKLVRSGACIVAAGVALVAAGQIKANVDVTEDRRNSFSVADQATLAGLTRPLVITVHLAPEDPRYVDLNRNILAKLERTLAHVAVRLSAGRQSFLANAGEESYGEVDYAYDGRSATSRSTSPREILPLLYGLAGVKPPTSTADADYPGYPLVAGGQGALPWFFGGLPLLIVLAWWRARRPPRIDIPSATMEISHEQR